MGREWHNTQWETYAKEHSIVLNYTTPYVHQQNGKAERSMCTLLDVARLMLADAGLLPKYWADAIHTAAYTRNFILPSRNPRAVPAEHWLSNTRTCHICGHLALQHMHIYLQKSPHQNCPLILLNLHCRDSFVGCKYFLVAR
jgi:hypothetical protein